MSCSECEKYRLALERINEAIRGMLDAAPAAKIHDYPTEHGKLIAAAATAAGRTLSEISVAAGFAVDHLARICRGASPLKVYTAKLYGAELSLDLLPFAAEGKSKGWTRKADVAADPDAAPELPMGGKQAVA